MSTANLKDVTDALDLSGVEWYITMKNDSVNQIVARDNEKSNFSTWFLVDENENIEFESEEEKNDFFEVFV